MKLIMTKGLPGSGKSTWAKQQNAYRVNKDDLRAMMNNGKWSKTNERYVLMIRDSIVRLHLGDKNDVIVDDTNLHPKHEINLRNIAAEFGAEFLVQDFTDVALDECIKRDQKRPNYVGEKVIRKMYNQFLKSVVEKVDHVDGLEHIVICDLDGTLCLFGDKNPYDRDFENDLVNHAVLKVIKSQDKVIFFSGRNGKYFNVTRKWLDVFGLDKFDLYMRSEDDSRKDSIVKQELYEKHIKGKYNVDFVLDDRDQVVELWRGLGLTCFQVAPGDF